MGMAILPHSEAEDSVYIDKMAITLTKLMDITMAATQLLCHLVGIDPSKLSREEILILEAELFARICEELNEIFRNQHRDYFHLMKLTIEKENAMLEANFV